MRLTISFDLDGTLVDYDFVNSIWLEGIPHMFAEKKQMRLNDARELVKKEYDAVGMERLEWYSIEYWLKRFCLNEDWRPMFKSYKSRINLYPETFGVLEQLKSENYQLVLITNSPKEFFTIELEETGIGGYFSQIFSATSDFCQVKNTTDFYFKIASILKVSPSQMVHIGDNWNFDYVIPKETGLVAFYLDRGRQRKGDWIVGDLKEFEEKLHLL